MARVAMLLALAVRSPVRVLWSISRCSVHHLRAAYYARPFSPINGAAACFVQRRVAIVVFRFRTFTLWGLSHIPGSSRGDGIWGNIVRAGLFSPAQRGFPPAPKGSPSRSVSPQGPPKKFAPGVPPRGPWPQSWGLPESPGQAPKAPKGPNLLKLPQPRGRVPLP